LKKKWRREKKTAHKPEQQSKREEKLSDEIEIGEIEDEEMLDHSPKAKEKQIPKKTLKKKGNK